MIILYIICIYLFLVLLCSYIVLLKDGRAAYSKKIKFLNDTIKNISNLSIEQIQKRTKKDFENKTELLNYLLQRQKEIKRNYILSWFIPPIIIFIV